MQGDREFHVLSEYIITFVITFSISKGTKNAFSRNLTMRVPLGVTVMILKSLIQGMYIFVRY